MLEKDQIHQMKVLGLSIEKWVYLFIVLITGFVYYQTVNHQFTRLDDYSYIIDNPHVNTGLSVDNIIWSITKTKEANWHPLTWVSHMVDVQLFGLKPGGHHLVNVFIHLLNTILLLFFLHKSTRQFWPSALVAVLFAIHPVHVESVAWISERKDMLSTFFFLITLIFYREYVEKKQARYYLLAFSTLGLGLMSKPMLVTLPFVLLLLDYWPLQRFNNLKGQIDLGMLKGLLVEKIPFFVLIIGSAAITYVVQKAGGAMGAGNKFSVAEKLFNALVSYIRYIANAAVPNNLSILYPYPASWPIQYIVFSACALIAISVWAIYKIRKAPYFMVGWLFFLGTLVPVIGIVQVGRQSMADRYTYVPYIGLFIILSWALLAMYSRMQKGKKAYIFSIVSIVFIYTGMTYSNLSYWQNDMRLFKHALMVSDPEYTDVLAQKDSLIADKKSLGLSGLYSNLAISYAENGHYDQAEIHFLEVIRLTPKNYHSYWNLTLFYVNTKQFELARHNLDQAVTFGLKQTLKVKGITKVINLKRGVRMRSDVDDGK